MNLSVIRDKKVGEMNESVINQKFSRHRQVLTH